MLDVTFALVADFDGDKKLDLLVLNQGFNGQYFTGNGDLTFLGWPTSPRKAGRSAAWSLTTTTTANRIFLWRATKSTR